MSNNTNLHQSRRDKNGEFYTLYKDVEKEIQGYLEVNPDLFRGKAILCPCDDYKHSNFTEYFRRNFDELGIKRLISTCYKPNDKGKIQIVEKGNVTEGCLQGNGDFRSKEITEIRDIVDFVISNPPFHLTKIIIPWVMESEVDTILVGNLNAVTYSTVFPYIRENKLWLGNTKFTKFVQPGGEIKSFGNIYCYTNVPHSKYNDFLELNTMEDNIKYNKKLQKYFDKYTVDKYVIYDNYAALDVPYVECIPSDYDGLMGVPITFLDKYNPNQFEIIGLTASWDETPEMKVIKTSDEHRHNPFIKGKEVYRRLIIRPIREDE